jgi:hypothetical protein
MYENDLQKSQKNKDSLLLSAPNWEVLVWNELLGAESRFCTSWACSSFASSNLKNERHEK